MLLTKDQALKTNFQIPIGGKLLIHQPSLTVLGNVIVDYLTWDNHIQKVIIPSLANRVRKLRHVSAFMSPKFKLVYVNAIFRGKLTFTADAWEGGSQTMISKIQNIQDRAAKVVLGPFADKKS